MQNNRAGVGMQMFGQSHHGGGTSGQSVEQTVEFGSAVSAGLNKHLA